MLVLKSQVYEHDTDIAKFVNLNNIPREHIVSITEALGGAGITHYTIFFYADSEAKEILKRMLGWS